MKIIVSFFSLILLTTAVSHAQSTSVVEANTVTVANDFDPVVLGLEYNNPVVIAMPPSHDDDAPAHVRLRHVGAPAHGEGPPAFEMKIEKWGYLNNVHDDETVGYLVFESGGFTSIDGSRLFEVSKVSVAQTDAGDFQTVQFGSPFSQTPVVFAQVQTYNDPTPVVTRIRNVTTTGFDVLLQEEENENGTHAPEVGEEVGYLAFIPGQGGVLLGIDYKVDVQPDVNDTFSLIDFSPIGFINPPIFIASMQTFNESDTAGLRYRNLTTTGVEVFVEEEESSDSETGHALENVGYLLVEGNPDSNIPAIIDYPTSLLDCFPTTP